MSNDLVVELVRATYQLARERGISVEAAGEIVRAEVSKQIPPIAELRVVDTTTGDDVSAEYVADRPVELRSYYPELDPYGQRLDLYPDDSSGLVAGLLMLVLAFVLGIGVGVVGGWLIFG